ncbi:MULTISPECIES: DHA2 family efflux MFS transporter permease subunit [Rhizobium]|jgi:EmrB/QacA subfamily drug resistance transporter|uniref:DHA2 family efflux MFS transporter permease subunit n=1 Tax=Rhizobium TaxID=379 RepID=UPI001446A5DD|nr:MULTISPECIES: DHA2 family efflux MFS transporter permease subunit [Rhizobium]NKJ04578.1 EmrB/QacA subfamily drug resistance transporter [Rhizobium sp. SG741]NKJ37665.1 EmrB/QacA subfamily drug resistance transporter [Rhizobium sp. SG570]NTJ10173.1 DHA2 family efflux MFS transporter permease subunit [Rhizobium lusitanum]
MNDMSTHGREKEMQAAGSRSVSIALLVAGAFFMENLDGTVIATALPQMAVSFGARPVDLNIGMSAYLLTLGVFIPISGWISDRFGARLVFTTAVVVFTLASVLCGFANGVGSFVAMRILQGIGGAMMVPVGRLVVLNNTPKDKLISAIATITWPALVAPVLGPPLGGFITDHANWRWIFFLNLPLGILAFAFALILIPETKNAARPPFDWIGFVVSSIGLASLMYGLELVGRPDLIWLEASAYVVAGLVLLTVAVFHFLRTEHPLIDLSGLKLPTFAVTISGGSLFRTAIGAVPFLLPLMFQVGFGLSAFHAGMLTLAVFAGNLAMKPGTTPILRRFGFKPVLIVNGILNAAFIAACALFSPDTPVWLVVPVLFIGGMCRSMHFTALNTIAFADIPPQKMTGANTLFSTVFQLTMGMGIAVGAIGIRIGQAVSAPLGVGGIVAIEFRLAFVLLGIIALFAVLDCLPLDRRAGDNVARKQKAGAKKAA